MNMGPMHLNPSLDPMRWSWFHVESASQCIGPGS
uniref:Uncharacterized protein n=1 Tax=Setaria italica TaxID=4555 RepID=K3Y4E3_SETIT